MTKEYFINHNMVKMNSKIKLTDEQARELIPHDTIYCKGDTFCCPFLFKLKYLPRYENGYCAYLDITDFDINQNKGVIKSCTQDGKCFDITDAHTLQYSTICNGVKMCNIK